jgi:SOS-response transcriptional repressor LexA
VQTIDEILDIIKKSGISVQDISKQTGIKDQNLYKWLQGKSRPKAIDFGLLSNWVEINTSSFSKPVEPNYQKHRNNIKTTQKDNDLTYYEIGASAGTAHAAEILPVKKSEGVLHINDLFRGSQYAIRVSGNSMTPNYPSGAIIGIREIPDKQITPGSVYIIEKDNDLWIKRMFYKNDDQASGIFECVSDNTMKYENGTGREGRLYYPPFYINIDEVRKLFKVTGIYKPNELTVIN